jgi:hypothetical protein
MSKNLIHMIAYNSSLSFICVILLCEYAIIYLTNLPLMDVQGDFEFGRIMSNTAMNFWAVFVYLCWILLKSGNIGS